MQPFAIVALVLILARAIAELWLSRLNQHHVRAHANELPPAFRGIIDKATYRRSVDYTLAKSHFADITGVFDVVVLIAVLFSGVLPWAFGRFTATFGTSIWAMASFLFFIGIGFSIFALAQRTGFPTRSIDVMDGSKRSRHSNAFFTGFGRFRKIVLFDTLIAQLSEPELESVLAHEIGHYKKRHVVKLLGFSIAGVFVAFAAIASLARQEWFYRAFGFEHQGGFAAGNVVVAMLLFGLLAGTISFWLSPFIHILSRRFEYEADAFARATMREGQSLIQALRQLREKNLSNLNPHPLYSCFYYSHPTLLERERALRIAV